MLDTLANVVAVKSGIAQRIANIEALEPEERKEAYEQLCTDPQAIDELFPDMVKKLPDDFAGHLFSPQCYLMDKVVYLSWIVNHKHELEAVHDWTMCCFRNIACEYLGNSSYSDYHATQETVWHQLCQALISHNPQPVKEWQRLLRCTIEWRRVRPSWIRWIIDAGRRGQFQGVSAQDVNNELLCDLLEVQGITLGAKNQLLELFSRPVEERYVDKLLRPALQRGALEECRNLFVKIGARPSEAMMKWLKDNNNHLENGHLHLDNLITYYWYVERYSPHTAMAKFVADSRKDLIEHERAFDSRKDAINARYRKERNELEQQFQQHKRQARLRKEQSIAEVEDEQKKHTEKWDDCFIPLSRALRFPD